MAEQPPIQHADDIIKWALGAVAALAFAVKALVGRRGHVAKKPPPPADRHEHDASCPSFDLQDAIGQMRIPDRWLQDFEQIADRTAIRRMEEHEDEVNGHVEHLRELSASFKEAATAGRLRDAEVERRLAALESAASEFRRAISSIDAVAASFSDAVRSLPLTVAAIIEDRERRGRA